VIQFLKRHGAAFLASLAISLPASATTYSIDYTDLWWNQNENGWGVNLIQQYETIFATLFVYGTDNSARWYVASGLMPSGGSQSVFTGPLYQTTGPYFGSGTFSTPPVGVTQVGTMTFSFNGPASGTLNYSVNGVNVTKAITRQNWRNNVLTGRYIGGLTAIGTNCQNVANGPILVFDNLNVTQNGNSVTMTVTYFTSATMQFSCTFLGTYTPSGRLASISGTWACTAGNQGLFSMPTVEASANGFNSVFTGSDQFCTYNGFFGGVHDIL
jgi:hypothetical protein